MGIYHKRDIGLIIFLIERRYILRNLMSHYGAVPAGREACCILKAFLESDHQIILLDREIRCSGRGEELVFGLFMRISL